MASTSDTEPHPDLLGMHYLADFIGCPVEKIATVAAIEGPFRDILARHGATVLGHQSHQFQPEGATVVVLLAESHASIHTWPEKGAACVDFFTCSSALQAEEALEELANCLGARTHRIRVVRREAAVEAITLDADG